MHCLRKLSYRFVSFSIWEGKRNGKLYNMTTSLPCYASIPSIPLPWYTVLGTICTVTNSYSMFFLSLKMYIHEFCSFSKCKQEHKYRYAWNNTFGHLGVGSDPEIRLNLPQIWNKYPNIQTVDIFGSQEKKWFEILLFSWSFNLKCFRLRCFSLLLFSFHLSLLSCSIREEFFQKIFYIEFEWFDNFVFQFFFLSIWISSEFIWCREMIEWP